MKSTNHVTHCFERALRKAVFKQVYTTLIRKYSKYYPHRLIQYILPSYVKTVNTLVNTVYTPSYVNTVNTVVNTVYTPLIRKYSKYSSNYSIYTLIRKYLLTIDLFGTFSIVHNFISESLSYFLMVIKENE